MSTNNHNGLEAGQPKIANG
jgi:hypothetical protein